MRSAPVIFLALFPDAGAQEKITYDDHVLPVFQQACLNCHNPDKAKGGLDLSSFTATLKGSSGGKIVEPGDVGSSLIAVVQHSAEPVMPPEGEKLATAQIDILKRWIEGGLLENNSSSARKPTKPKFELAQRTDPATKPAGPPPMPAHLLLEPPVVTEKAAAIQSLAASPWAPLLAITSQRQVLLHHTETLDLIGILPFPEGDPVTLAFTPDARYLIVGGGVPGKSGVTVTFDVTNGSRLLGAGREFDSILAADIRPGFDLVATGGPSRMLKIWNTETGEAVHSIKKHTDWITALDISPDGVLLASGDRNGGVWVWESATANEFHTLRAHQARISAAVFRADSNILGTASEDGTLRFWEMNNGSEVKKIDAHRGGVTSFAFARNGSSLSAGRDSKVSFWKPDFSLAKEITGKHPALPTAVALDSEAKTAFVGDAQGHVHAYLTADGRKTGVIPGNPPSIENRLLTINTAIKDHRTLITAIADSIAKRKNQRDQARQALEKAQKTCHQAVEIHKAAQSGADATPEDAHKKLAAEALARIQPAKDAENTKRAELEAAEKSLAEATQGDKTARSGLNRLLTERKRWQAAAINTRLLEARRLAETTAASTEDTQLKFTEAAAKIARQAETLNRKRAERAQLARLGEGSGPPGWSPQAKDELNATLAALDIVIARELGLFQAAEAELAVIARSIDPAVLLAHGNQQQVESLQQAYHKALE
jgi:hypothetical protein